MRGRAPRSFVLATILLMAVCSATSCGSSAGTSSPGVSNNVPGPPGVPGNVPTTPGSNPSVAGIVGDDWTTYAHDQLRTGLESQSGLSASNVNQLALKWSFSTGDAIYSSPLAYGGLIIVCTADTGIVYALSSQTGKVVWTANLGGQVRMTPTIADGLVFVGTHLFTTDANGKFYPAPSALYALDLTTGAIRWRAPVLGSIRGEVVVAGGRVFTPIAGGDLPTCLRGGVQAFDEQSGGSIWNWYVDVNSGRGGAVWAPISYDGQRLIVGTGNTCDSPVTTANGLVALDPASGALDWSILAQLNSLADDDTGGGALVSNSMIYFINKNGIFYAVDRASGAQRFSVVLNAIDGNGGFATPTTDGSTIVVSGGYQQVLSPASRQFYTVRRRRDATASQSLLYGLDLLGHIKWTIASANANVSYVAIANGMGIATLDNMVTAIDLASGSKLWSFATSDFINGGAAVVSSGVYVADAAGNVYALSLPSTAKASIRR